MIRTWQRAPARVFRFTLQTPPGPPTSENRSDRSTRSPIPSGARWSRRPSRLPLVPRRAALPSALAHGEPEQLPSSPAPCRPLPHTLSTSPRLRPSSAASTLPLCAVELEPKLTKKACQTVCVCVFRVGSEKSWSSRKWGLEPLGATGEPFQTGF